MDSTEEMENKKTSEEFADNNKTEGEIKDSEAEGAVGGMWGGFLMEVVPQSPYQQVRHQSKLW